MAIYQECNTHHGLLGAKARLEKKGLTMLKLDLISAHMPANLVDNVSGLEGYVVRSLYGRTDSTAVLHWITGQGSLKQFVSNRVAQIKAMAYLKCRYSETEQTHPV